MTDAETEIKYCEALFDHMSDISVIDSACCKIEVRAACRLFISFGKCTFTNVFLLLNLNGNNFCKCLFSRTEMATFDVMKNLARLRVSLLIEEVRLSSLDFSKLLTHTLM
jgi:hypothetical protein